LEKVFGKVVDRTTEDMPDKQVLLLTIIVCVAIYFLLPQANEDTFDDGEGKTGTKPVGDGAKTAHESVDAAAR
jgi:hypothetical protein